jgi:hypothetical protein
MLRQELLYTARDTSLTIRPAAVWAGTTVPDPTSRRSLTLLLLSIQIDSCVTSF